MIETATYIWQYRVHKRKGCGLKLPSRIFQATGYLIIKFNEEANHHIIRNISYLPWHDDCVTEEATKLCGIDADIAEIMPPLYR